MVPTRHIFHTIMTLEKSATIKPKDKHVWVKDCIHSKTCTINVEFPDKSIIQQLPAIMSSTSKRNSECVVFLPGEGKLLGVADRKYLCFDYACRIEGSIELPYVNFKCNVTTMKHIYGQCVVDFYQDTNDQYSIVITNENGWQTCIHSCLSQFENSAVSQMIDVLETDKPIPSKYHSEWYTDDRDPNPVNTSINSIEDCESEKKKELLSSKDQSVSSNDDDLDESSPSPACGTQSLSTNISRELIPYRPNLDIQDFITFIPPHEEDVRRYKEHLQKTNNYIEHCEISNENGRRIFSNTTMHP